MLSSLEKTGRGIAIRDLLVGAAARQESYAVATENKEHFQRIPRLIVLTEQELLQRLAQADRGLFHQVTIFAEDTHVDDAACL